MPGDGALSVGHRLFLQGLMASGWLESAKAEALVTKIAAETECAMGSLSATVSAINAKIKPFELSIATTLREDDGIRVYGMVNTINDDAAKLGTTLGKAELHIFRTLLEKIVDSSDGAINMMTAIQYGTDRKEERHLTTSGVEELCGRLCDEGWLREPKGEKGKLTLGPRTMLELPVHIRNNWGDDAQDCCVCHNLAIWAQVCVEPDCNAKVHGPCLARFCRTLGKDVCPKCKAVWVGDIPDVALDAEPQAPGAGAGGAAMHDDDKEKDDDDDGDDDDDEDKSSRRRSRSSSRRSGSRKGGARR